MMVGVPETFYHLSPTGGTWFWPPGTEFGDPELVGGIPVVDHLDENSDIENE